jgi:homopolymeric O-antigen transport system ATP-binding protein
VGDSVAISVQNVSKKYRLFNSPKDRLWEALSPFKKIYHQEFWALKDISLTIEKGQTFGLVGRNGAGKSTLLQIICSVLRPTSGQVQVNGRVSALLELGAGFHSEFTGRENAVFKGALMGFSKKEMQERLPEIEAFADIGDFINQPVKFYSSGMFARLAFAVAIHVDPEILIVDEILTVGDAKFQHKCFQKFHEFQKQRRTIILVSHDTNLILKHCSRALFIERGNILENGHPKDVVDAYLNFVMTGYLDGSEENEVTDASSLSEQSKLAQTELEKFLAQIPKEDNCLLRRSYNVNEYRLGNRKASIIDYLVVAEGKTDVSSIYSGSQVEIYIKTRFHQATDSPMFGFALKTVDGVIVSGNNSRFSQHKLKPVVPGEVVVFRFTLSLKLQPGDYFVDLGVAEKLPVEDNQMDTRNSLIHIHVGYKHQFTGLVDLQMSSEEITRLTESQRSLV